jgi:hypothetical protein
MHGNPFLDETDCIAAASSSVRLSFVQAATEEVLHQHSTSGLVMRQRSKSEPYFDSRTLMR